ncbi:MlaE family ABC transporter permease [Desulfoferula mesophila]|uniref:MlaE family ABC transporter permease n=1 Tax=Desulfoferula mesophila TaxID=3058419 RepID=UPI0030CA7BB5
MSAACSINLTRPSPQLLAVHLAGDWLRTVERPSAALLRQELDAGPSVTAVDLEAEGITSWDSTLLIFVQHLREVCSEKKLPFTVKSLPDGAVRLLDLAAAVPERKGARRKFQQESFLERVGLEARAFQHSAGEMLDFIGAVSISSLKLIKGHSKLRVSDMLAIAQECSVQALPIVSLISLLVGLILGFVGAVQLQMFGAQIYVASLVGVAMIRVMGAIMTGIIMAGRTGAAFAAQLGTMQVNEEIDALRTMGIPPMEFLVLPRVFSLALMMPLLCVYADLLGVLGGLIVGVGMLNIGVVEYYNQTVLSVSLADFAIGILQAAVFGVLVAVAGCMRGMQCGRSASAVGNAATSAVVTSIVSIIVATALITLMCNVLGI